MATWTDIENRFKEICDRYTDGDESKRDVIAAALLRRLEKVLDEDALNAAITEDKMFSNGVTNNAAVIGRNKAVRIMPDGQLKINNQWGIIQPRLYCLEDFTAGRVSGKFYSVLPLTDIIEHMGHFNTVDAKDQSGAGDD